MIASLAEWLRRMIQVHISSEARVRPPQDASFAEFRQLSSSFCQKRIGFSLVPEVKTWLSKQAKVRHSRQVTAVRLLCLNRLVHSLCFRYADGSLIVIQVQVQVEVQVQFYSIQLRLVEICCSWLRHCSSRLRCSSAS